MWSKAVFPTPHGAQWVPALENAVSFLTGTACCFLSIAPAQTWSPSPSKALLFPSIDNVLWSIFAEEKVTCKQRRKGKSTKPKVYCK
uniref:Uncharacterized protein n=1 Tax=Colobus angolensis palliatus TaxID=336983 RepID=A0A2K5JSE4_COLAP